MTKRMFEFSEGTSNKFWEAWFEGTEVRTRYGKIGTAGQTTIKDEGDEEKAAKLLAKLIGEKTKKGYVEVSGAPAKAAPKAEAKPVEAKAAKPEAVFDPEPYAAAIAKITAAAKKRGFALPAGATEKKIQATESTLGVTFPEEVRAFYLAHNGGSSTGAFVCNARELLSLENIVSQWKIWKQLFDKGTFKGNQSSPSAGVKNDWWIPAWIPMTYDGAGNHEVLDLDPAKGGKVGQVVGFWHDDDTRTLHAPDFLTWLASVQWTEDMDDDGEDEEDGEEKAGEGGWRRFEVDEKFWSIKREGTSFTVKYGKIGAAGQEKTKDFGDEDAAEAEYGKLVQEKTKKGYEEV